MTKLYESVREFLAKYCRPEISKERIIQGWQNRMHLPPDDEDYIVMSLMSEVEHGTPVTCYSNGIEVYSIRESVMQIDFCSSDDTSRIRASNISSICRSALATDFFRKYDVGMLFCDATRDISFVGDASQYIRRNMIQLHLSHRSGIIDNEFEYSKRVNLSRIENVETHHKTGVL